MTAIQPEIIEIKGGIEVIEIARQGPPGKPGDKGDKGDPGDGSNIDTDYALLYEIAKL